MFELDDCGKECHLINNYKEFDTTIQMIIKAPGGTMVLFDQKYISPDSQCEAIKAFMEEHRND